MHKTPHKTFIPILTKLLETITDSFVRGLYAFYNHLYNNINAPNGLIVDMSLTDTSDGF